MRRALTNLAARLGLDRLAYRVWRYNPSGLRRLFGHHHFDRQFHVETRGYGDLRYEPTPAPILAEILDSLELDFSQYLFIDVGSGKGKVLLMAADYPFKRIIGIERYADLHRIAENNLAVCASGAFRCHDIQSICVDAATYEIPAEPTIFYFFNPFAKEILIRVLGNIEASLKAQQRSAYIIFYAPILRRGAPWDRRLLFDESKYFEVVRETKAYTIYKAT